MKYNLAIWGACITRDSFRSDFNPQWKEYFDIKIDYQRHSIITAMQNRINVDEDLITIKPENKSNNFRTKILQDEFNRSFIDKIKNQRIDYLIFDMDLESQMGIIKYEDNYISNDFMDLPLTEFYKKLKDKEIISMKNNEKIFYSLWTQKFDELVDFIKKHQPHLKIILNEVVMVDKYRAEDNTIVFDEELHQKASTFNPIIKKLEKYIKDNHDVYLIKFNPDFLVDPNHIWGKGVLHFQNEYYQYFMLQLRSIVTFDKMIEEQTKGQQFKNKNGYIEINKNEKKIEKIINKIYKILQKDDVDIIVFHSLLFEIPIEYNITQSNNTIQLENNNYKIEINYYNFETIDKSIKRYINQYTINDIQINTEIFGNKIIKQTTAKLGLSNYIDKRIWFEYDNKIFNITINSDTKKYIENIISTVKTLDEMS